MGLNENKTDSYPGAEWQASEPIGKSDCCQGQSVPLMAGKLATAGLPYIVKGGAIFIDATAEEIATACGIGTPTISNANPIAGVTGTHVTTTGTNYGAVQGKAWLTNAATWAGSSIFVEQGIQSWATGQVVFSAAQDSLPIEPEFVYIYIENDCGERNTAGWPWQFVAP